MLELGRAMPRSYFLAWLDSATLMNFWCDEKKKTTQKMKTISNTILTSKMKTTYKIKVTQKGRRPQKLKWPQIWRQMKMNWKMKTSSKIVPSPHNNIAPPYYYDNTWIFLKASHLDSHTTNNVKPEMLSGVQTGNRIPYDEYNVRGIAHARAYRKYNIFIQRRLVQSFEWKESGGRGLKVQNLVLKVQPFNNSNRDFLK